MNSNILENFLTNFIFISLFITMFFYWFKASFLEGHKNDKIEIFLLIICNFSLTLLLLLRWIESNHLPLSNLYESLIFLCWGLSLFLLFLQIRIKENYIGILITPIILFINSFASFSLPPEMQKATSLVPALQSNWLMMHVTIMMLSYAALIFGSLLAIAFLVLIFVQKLLNENLTPIILNKSQITQTSLLLDLSINKQKENTNSNLITNLDNLSYRTLGFGFPLLTIGILSGAVWANETWGSYWSWDPKETWALITWFIYAIYLHSRIIKGWTGIKPALIATFGFLSVWICYLGVNLFGKGLHSYGWFNFT